MTQVIQGNNGGNVFMLGGQVSFPYRISKVSKASLLLCIKSVIKSQLLCILSLSSPLQHMQGNHNACGGAGAEGVRQASRPLSGADLQVIQGNNGSNVFMLGGQVSFPDRIWKASLLLCIECVIKSQRLCILSLSSLYSICQETTMPLVEQERRVFVKHPGPVQVLLVFQSRHLLLP